LPPWRERLQTIWGQATGRRRQSEVFEELRTMALGVDPASLQAPDDEPWSGAAVAAMELGLPDATVTIVAVADGTVSMYLSTGGGVIGAGDHAAVRGPAQRFRTVVADSRGMLQRTTDFPRPGVGEVRFQARIGDDRFTGVATEAVLRAGRHPLSPLYAAGQDVLTEIRLVTEPDR
jgi:hypothetical protein